MSEAMAFQVAWIGNKVQILLMLGEQPMHSDTCDPRSDLARRRTVDRIRDAFPGLDVSPIERRLLELATQGPPQPKQQDEAIAFVPANPEPHETEVDGADLLDELSGTFSRFVILPDHGADALGLWCLHSFVYERFTYSPRLQLTSPERRCGKSIVLRLVAALSARPLGVENITAAALYRSVEKFAPTLILDEADSYLGGKNVNEDLRGVVNAGFQKGGCVLRCTGDDSEPTPFRVFGPLAMGGIGRLPATIEDRSIAIPMRRKMRGETVDKIPPGRSLREVLQETVRRSVRWAQDNGESLATATPAVPQRLDDRAADAWWALLAIADAAGGDWPERARRAAVALSASREQVDSLGLMLLADLRDVFTEQQVDRLKTDTILRLLLAKEERPWPAYRSGRAINARQVARLLEPFDVRPTKWKAPDGTVRGYVADESMTDAWGRYLPEAGFSASGPATAATALQRNGLGGHGSATYPTPVAAPSATRGGGSEPVADGGGTVADASGTVSACKQKRWRMVAPVAQEKALDELHELVDAMAVDLDSAGLDGAALREQFAALTERAGVDAALTEARRRYEAQVNGHVPEASSR